MGFKGFSFVGAYFAYEVKRISKEYTQEVERMDIRGIDNSMQTIRGMEPVEQYADPATVTIKPITADEAMVSENTKQGEDTPMSEQEQRRWMNRLQDTLKNHNIEISYNEEVNRYAIKVLDADSKEVVKEIPSEKTLEVFAKMLEIEGLLVDEKR